MPDSRGGEEGPDGLLDEGPGGGGFIAAGEGLSGRYQEWKRKRRGKSQGWIDTWVLGRLGRENTSVCVTEYGITWFWAASCNCIKIG